MENNEIGHDQKTVRIISCGNSTFEYLFMGREVSNTTKIQTHIEPDQGQNLESHTCPEPNQPSTKPGLTYPIAIPTVGCSRSGC